MDGPNETVIFNLSRFLLITPELVGSIFKLCPLIGQPARVYVHSMSLTCNSHVLGKGRLFLSDMVILFRHISLVHNFTTDEGELPHLDWLNLLHEYLVVQGDCQPLVRPQSLGIEEVLAVLGQHLQTADDFLNLVFILEFRHFF